MSDSPTMPELLACAVDAATHAGRHAYKQRALRKDTVAVLKHDIKLKLDLECQTIAEGVILEKYPSHRILGEEGIREADQDGTAPFEWIIDPIDGTVNFAHGLPLWCCSIAVRQGDTIVAGAVHIPEREETFCATIDGPALLNGHPISVSDTPDMAHAMIMTGLDKDLKPGVPPLAVFSAISTVAQKTRICGSAAMDICSVACGRADGYFEGQIYLWDIAAAGLIVERAGGQIEHLGALNEPHRLCFMASNGHIHEPLRERIRSAI